MATDGTELLTGGCLCGALRYEARGEPLYAGLCCCGDCRKVSGSGFVAFMGSPAGAVRLSGASRAFTSKAANGNDATRQSCPVCGSLACVMLLLTHASSKVRACSQAWIEASLQYQPDRL